MHRPCPDEAHLGTTVQHQEALLINQLFAGTPQVCDRPVHGPEFEVTSERMRRRVVSAPA